MAHHKTQVFCQLVVILCLYSLEPMMSWCKAVQQVILGGGKYGEILGGGNMCSTHICAGERNRMNMQLF